MPQEKISGVYMIHLIGSDECYVGSSIDVYKRWCSHKYRLRNNCSHFVLQAVWNLHGEDKFEFVLIECCDPSHLAEREQYYIDNLNSKYNGNRSVTEWILTEEARKGLSVKLTARHARMSDDEKEELKEKISDGNKRWALKYPEAAMARVKNPDGSHVNATLIEQEILDIYLSPETQEEASNRYGISQALVSGIRSGKRWAHVQRPEVPQEVLDERKRRERLNNRGENSSSAEFTVEDIINIKTRIASGKWGILAELAREYNVTHSTLQQIRDGKAWAHVQVEGLENNYKKSVHFDEDDVREIKKRLASGGYGIVSQIAREYGVTPQSIQQIKDGKSWAHIV